MEGQELPPWADDELSKPLGMAEYNTRAAFHNLPEIYNALERTYRAFARAREAVEKDNRQVLLIPRLLLVRVQASCLASARLALGGELPETYVMLRAEIEQAWYALHLAKDPNPPGRAETWLRRDEGDEAMERCRNEFSVRNVRSTHEGIDGGTARELHRLYKRAIDFGAHPNPLGVLSGLTQSEAERTTTYNVPLLCADRVPMLVTTRDIAAVGIGALKVFQEIFSTRFQLVGLDAEIAALVAGLNTVFKRYLRGSDAPGDV